MRNRIDGIAPVHGAHREDRECWTRDVRALLIRVPDTIMAGEMPVFRLTLSSHLACGPAPSQPTLAEVHGSMAAGLLSARTPDGQWVYGQALLKASAQM